MESNPCTAAEAVERARAVCGNGGQYLLGTGDYWPHVEAGINIDLPWTYKSGKAGADCAGFAICYAWKLARHRRGFNKGPWATVSDDINSDSAYEDALNKKELFSVTKTPRPGDLLVYPSVRRAGVRILIGHVGLIEAVPAEWDVTAPQYDLLTILQCKGPNGRKPGVVRTDGSIWSHHDANWSKPQHRTVIIRPHERA